MKTSLFICFLSFFKSVMGCEKPSLRYLCREVSKDCHSQMGKILSYLGKSCMTERNNIQSITQMDVKSKLVYHSTENSEKWRNWVAQELMQARIQNSQCLEIPGFNGAEIESLFQFICTEWSILNTFTYFNLICSLVRTTIKQTNKQILGCEN